MLRVIKSIYHLVNHIYFVICNILICISTKNIESININNYIFRPMKRNEINQLNRIYKTVFPNSFTIFRNKLLWWVLASKLVLVVEDENTKQIIGFACLYVNKRDYDENSIHLGQIGIINQYRGLGISKIMHRLLIEHFQKSKFKAISIRISLNNKNYLNSALKTGYKPVEKYFDDSTNEERYYLKRLL